MKFLFLDIDGVLNGHESVHGCCIIQPRCVPHLNRIITETDCKLVISSSWRYMVHNGAMTLLGFEYMLRTHGINAAGRLHGITATDEDSPSKNDPDDADDYSQRQWQIQQYMRRNPCDSYVILDDGKMNMPFFVQTDGTVGLTSVTANSAIRFLTLGACHEACRVAPE